MNDNPLHRYCGATILNVWDDLTKRWYQRMAWKRLLLLQTRQGIIKTEDMNRLNQGEFETYDQDKFKQALSLEKVTKHDLAADLLLAEQELPTELKSKIHWGATSSDIEDFATNQQIISSIDLVLAHSRLLIDKLADFCLTHSRTVVLGRTHLQPAEPTTLGYRFAVYLNELWIAYQDLKRLLEDDQTNKSFRGAVGTMGDYFITGPQTLPYLDSFPCGQTYPRQRDYRILAVLCDFAATLHKMSSDIRIMQSFKLVWEGKADGQIGSSAMPAKSNPILSERICAICRHIKALAGECWDTAANSFLERTLDDKISQRWYLSESFISCMGALNTAIVLFDGLKVNVDRCRDEVWEEWRAWAPARKLALAQKSSTLPRSVLYKDIEDKLNHSTSLFEFMQPEMQLWQGPNVVYNDSILAVELAAEITKHVSWSIKGQPA